jgi:hypothetical protein
MSNYTIAVAWSGKDALSDSDAAKVISGDDFNTEFSAVQTAVNTKADINGSATESFSATTASASTDTTQVATTAFVTTAVAAIPGTTNVFTATQIWAKGTDVASATALTVGAGNYFDVTGTTTVTSIATVGIGVTIKLHFDGAVLLTHGATDLVLPGGANVTTAAGDEFEFTEYATGDWRCTGYALASGEAIIGAATTSEDKLAQAWINYNGVTNTILGSYNVSTIADRGTGKHTVNFTTNMSNANYAALSTNSDAIGGNDSTTTDTLAVGSYEINNHHENAAESNYFLDSASISSVVFGE